MISVGDVRRWALALPETEEHEHWGRPSFRVRGKIFATLWPKERRAILKLPLPDQEDLARTDPETYTVGSWGKQGYTAVELRRADPGEFREHLTLACRQLAPKRALRALDGEG